jgi:enamine deaminase RidA (YjgF/YER057c/UK114 family)
MKLLIAAAVSAAMLSGCATAAPVQDIKRQGGAGGIPIASVVSVPDGHDLIFVSGMLPANTAPQGQPVNYGDTETQGLSVLKRLKEALALEGASFADVTTVRVFLVGDPKMENRMDFAGFNRAFATEFGTAAQANKPTRTVVQVVALPAPGALVEVDVIAARKRVGRR